jgi:hypothetical protein
MTATKEQVAEHAYACRVAYLRGNPIPAWTGGSLSGLDLSGLNLRGATLTSWPPLWVFAAATAFAVVLLGVYFATGG